MRNTRTELRLDCRKRKTHRANRLPTSPKRKNREYRTARGRRRAWSSNVHTVLFEESTEEVEMEKGDEWGGRDVAANKDDIETGREEVEIGREELGDAAAERVKGKDEADEKGLIVCDNFRAVTLQALRKKKGEKKVSSLFVTE